MSDAYVTHLGPGLVVGEVGPVCVTIWRDAVDAPRFEKQAAGVVSIAKRFPNRSAFVCIVEPTSAPPDDALRRASIALINDNPLACVAGVVEGTGFKASIARSVLSGMTLFFRGRAPHRFFSDVRSAAEWLKGHVDVEPASFASTVELWRAELPEPSSPLG